MQYIDMHCDTLSEAYRRKKETISQVPEFMLDIRRLKKADCLAQFFAIFMLPESIREEFGGKLPEDAEYIKAVLGIFRKTMEEQAQTIALACSVTELEKNETEGKISAILTVEDGRVVDGGMERLLWLREEGIRMITLTWNSENCFGYPHSTDKEIMGKGLKPFGCDALQRMNEWGIAVDVSHLSDGGFWDVVRLSGKPFVASHSNCRELSPHSRNLTDEMIRALAQKGGVMGVNICGAFLNTDASTNVSTAERMAAHLKHVIKVGGIDTAAIGTDFDGTRGDFEISSCSHMPLLFDALEKMGFKEEQIEKIAFKNVKRVMRDTMG